MLSADRFLNEVRQYSLIPSTINDHLETIFLEALALQPKLLVELGVEYGGSTFALQRVSLITGAKLISVDLKDCSGISSFEDWSFIQKNDIDFAAEFPLWCDNHGITPLIDLLFIDTSHLYEHTRQEIQSWFPYLAVKAKVIFHDTNMYELYLRRDGSVGGGWNNARGVIRAIEEYFGKSFNETADFSDSAHGWQIKHYAICSGLTILSRNG